MPLAPLAVAADLSTRGVDVTDTARVTAALAAASETVRDAAGCPISEVTATITLPAPLDQWLELPGPVSAVTSVAVDGVAVTTFVRQGSLLWLRGGWRTCSEPVNVDVVLTFGLATVPADIVALVCDLATASLMQDSPAAAGTSSIAIDDYRETFTTGDDAVASVFELPPRTRAWLRQRFGSSAVVTDVR